MRSVKTFTTTAVMIIVGLVWTSCKKEQAPPTLQQNNSVASTTRGGVIADDPQRVSKVPFIISSALLNSSPSSARHSRPKPVSGSGGTSGTDSTGTGGTSGTDSTGSTGGTGSTGSSGSFDVTPPSVTITSPTQGQNVDASTITVSVDASDDVGVSSVTLSVNGSPLSTLSNAPYNFSWDASSYAGTFPTLTATATDATGNASATIITVAVNANVVVLPPPPSGNVPSSFTLQTPPVANQGNEWACVPFATVYAARSIEEYYRTGASSYSPFTNICSPEYVYDQTKFSDCGSGTAITTTLDLMQNKGVCLWGTLPYSDMDGCDASIATPFDGEAANYRISSYGKLLNNDVTGIKTMLLNHHPVIASLAIDNSFLNAGPGFIWSSYSGSGGAGHSLIICGYDDSIQAYKVMSSWGTGWADAGYSWISYDFFPTRAGYYVYVMNY